ANGALLFTQARSPAYVRRITDDLYRERWQEQVVCLEELRPALDRGTAALLGSIVESAERLLALSEPDGIAPGRGQMAELLAHCLRLARKRVQLQGFLAERSNADLEREVGRLRRQVESTAD